MNYFFARRDFVWKSATGYWILLALAFLVFSVLSWELLIFIKEFSCHSDSSTLARIIYFAVPLALGALFGLMSLQGRRFAITAAIALGMLHLWYVLAVFGYLSWLT